ncbi:MAG TPA: CPBP family intramembrane glutamic endopeptidase [Anaerolineae bacterium]
MSRISLNPVTQVPAGRPIGLGAVWVFCLVTVVLSVAVLLLLPGYAGPALVVFIPTILAVSIITLTAGKSQVRPRLFSARAWRLSLKWLLISLGVALALRLGVSLLGLLFVPGYQLQPGPFSPLLLMALIFAAGEEIGWRRFALPTLLAHGYRPLPAALFLGVPWALVHLPLVLPGMLSAGTPMLAQFLIMMSLSVLVTWAYLAGGNTLSPAVLLHGGQNIFVILNNGLNPVASGWLMAAVYGAAALLVILLSRGRLGQPASNAQVQAGGLRETVVSG